MRKPNVILMFVDDLGYGDISSFNEESKIQTPNIDNLAARGMKFTDSHSCSSVCTPARYGLLTGRYAFRSRLKYSVLVGDSMTLIEKDRMTMAHMFKNNGYNTACVGKWHLGLEWQPKENYKTDGLLGNSSLYENIPKRTLETGPLLSPATPTYVEGLDIDYTKPILYGPNKYGFDYFYGMAASLDSPPFLYIENNMVTEQPTYISGEFDLDRKSAVMQQKWQCGPLGPSFDHEKVLDDFNDKVLDLIDDYSQKEDPFFIYYPTPAVHGPLLPNEKFKGKSGLNAYADVVMQVDDMVKSITDKLIEKDILDDTIFIFTSDNGCSAVADIDFLTSKGHYPSYKYRGYKFSLYEGGHRVPTIVSYPKMIKQNSVSNAHVCHTDFFKTFAEILGEQIPDDAAEDSFTNLNLWNGTGECERTSTIYSCFTGYLAIYKGDYKLACSKDGGMNPDVIRATYRDEGCAPEFELYNIKIDPAETTNIYDENPEIARELKAELTRAVENGRVTKGEKQSNEKYENWFQINW